MSVVSLQSYNSLRVPGILNASQPPQPTPDRPPFSPPRMCLLFLVCDIEARQDRRRLLQPRFYHLHLLQEEAETPSLSTNARRVTRSMSPMTLMLRSREPQVKLLARMAQQSMTTATATMRATTSLKTQAQKVHRRSSTGK